MTAFLGLLVVVACGLSFGTGFVIGLRSRKDPPPPPERKKRLVRLGTMRVSDTAGMAIPTTELFCRKESYEDLMPDEVWMGWPSGRRVHVYWYTDQEIP